MDWREPILARAEEVASLTGPDEHGGARRGILWHMPQESYDRVMSMNACWNCLTGFPARPMELTLGIWKRSGFNHVRPNIVAERLIKEGKCPVCASEISPEMLGLQDRGQNPLNTRRDDD